MYKVLIVDDEARERNIIKILLERYYPGMFEISETDNGLKALEKLKEEKYDLLLVDIKMPGLDGMGVIRELRNNERSIYTIIITAYNYFEYAKEAIKLDVNDLMLKPPVREEFCKVINQFIEKIKETKDQVNEEANEMMDAWLAIMKKDIVRSLIHGGSQYTEEYIDILGYDFRWGISMLFTFDTCHDQYFNANKDELQKVLIRMSDKIEKVLKDKDVQSVIDIYGDNVVVFLFCRQENQQFASESSLKLTKEIYHILQNNCQYKLQLGLGSPYAYVNELYQSYMESKKSVQFSTGQLSSKAINIYVDEHGEAEPSICFEKQIVKSIRNNDSEESKKILIDAYSEFIAKNRNEINSIKVKMIDFMGTVSKETIEHQQALKQIVMLEHIIEMNSVEQIYEYALNYLEKLIQLYQDEKEEKKHYIIDKAVKYIDEAYSQNLTIEEVAEKFSMSTFYFSKLFKSCQNISFIDYLTEVRLKKAIDYFEDESHRINEIAIRVGYSDANYFSRVFKKKYGVSPKEYRNRYL